MTDRLRIGFIGAGGIARSRHLPNLALINGVEVVAVCNRSQESGQRVAEQFGIPEVMDDWQAMVAREDLDAIFIGTWPDTHREMSIATLEAGKHCFCQARMAMNLEEARAMAAAARRHPRLVSMVCPPPTRMPFEPFIRQVMRDGILGQITGVHLVSNAAANLRLDRVTWRERIECSGRQILGMGIMAETLNAWVGEYRTLSATLATPISQKRDEQGREVEIHVPQVVSICGELVSGALIGEYFTGLAADKTTDGNELTIHGLEGTLRYRFGDTIELAKANQPLTAAKVPAALQRPWQVERDFAEAVRAARRGEGWSVSPDFDEALAYMRKVEAVHLSAEQGRAIRLSELP
jgi:predicted dehydrogenase